MLKTKLFILVVILVTLIPFTSRGQLIHAKGEMSAGLGVGYVQNGFNLSGKYNYLISNKFILSGSMLYENKAFQYSKLNYLSLEADALYTLYRIGNKFFFNGGVGLFFGLESSKSPIFSPYQNLTLGETISFSMDYYVVSKVVIRLEAKQRIHQMSKIGKFSWYSGIGVGYNF